MADYIYLLENRLSPAQRSAIRNTREVVRSKGLTIFLVGGAVRDLTSGSPVRDLDVVVQGNALKLKKELEKAGAQITGEVDSAQALFLVFPGSVRMEFGSTLTVSYPRPGKAVAKPASILEDLRRRDFTANAMALSLNDGSYGLLMDPLNGVADIENRQLRLVSNYGFIEDPVRMIRAARLMARLGWTLDEKTETRYQTGREEGYISAMGEFQRGYELEEIVHEEDPLRVLKRLEADGWMKSLAPFWNATKVNVPELERLRELQTQLEMQGIHPATAAANFPLLTAKLSPKEASSLKASFPRQGFVTEIDALEAQARDFGAQLTSKSAALPSQAWKLFTSASPEVVLWSAFSNKNATLQAKFKSFSTEWPQARQKMPYVMMQEMRIVPEMPGYDDLLEKLFFELMDGNLSTPEEMKAFLEPFSPPAPPPPVSLRRQRAPKKEAKQSKSRSKKTSSTEEIIDDVSEDDVPEDQALDGTATNDEVDEDDVSDEQEPPEVKAEPAEKVTSKTAGKSLVSASEVSAKVQVKAASPLSAKSGAKSISAKAAPAKSTPAKASKPKAENLQMQAELTKAAVTKASQKTPVEAQSAKAVTGKQPAKAVPAAKKQAAPATGKAAKKLAPAPPRKAAAPAKAGKKAVVSQSAAAKVVVVKKSAKKSAPAKSGRKR